MTGVSGRAVIIWPSINEPSSDEPIEVRAALMATEAISNGARKVWVVPRRYWGNEGQVLSEEEVASIQAEAEPMGFVDSNGTVNVRVIGAARNIQRQFRRAFENATL